jgi:hypothetical protein
MDKQQQTTYINKKITELTKKAHLKNKPKWDFEEIVLPAYTNPSRNKIQISESFRRQWEKGDFDEKDADALLAHEFGHLIDMKAGSKFVTPKLFSAYVLFLFALVLSVAFFVAAPINFCILAFSFSIWVLFLPAILKKAYVPRELKADSNAIGLIDAHQFANCIVKIQLMPDKNDRHYRFGGRVISRLVYKLELFRHPSLDERLNNIGFEIKFPINTKRKG